MHFAGSHGGVGGAMVVFAPGGGSAAAHIIRAVFFFSGDPIGVTGSVGAAGLALMVAVLGFLS
jgi:hypothetical protein